MILFVLAGLVARLDAAPGDDSIAPGQAGDLEPRSPLAPVSGDGELGDDPGDGIEDLVMLDAELGPPTAGDDADVVAASAPAAAAEAHESWMRQRGASGWGRLDVGVAWRRRATEPMFAQPAMRHELWLVATWRR